MDVAEARKPGKLMWTAARVSFAVFLLALVCLSIVPFSVNSPRAGARRAACIANLKRIYGAKVVWALEHHKSTNDIPTESDLFGRDL